MVEVQPSTTKIRPAGWPPGHKYGLPCQCQNLAGKRVRYVQPEKVPSYKPIKVFQKPDVKMPDDTTYSMSFEAFDPKAVRCCRGVPASTKENLASAGDFCGLTTHKLSYGAWPGITRPKQILPRDHNLRGHGPMQEITTSRHDYTPKPLVGVELIKQRPNIGLSKAPMEGDSIMGLSYKCPDYHRFEPTLSFKPDKRYLPPEAPMDGNTVQKMSYVPWEPLQKEDIPWGKREPYAGPRAPLDGNTIYNGSFIPPGKLIEDDRGHCMGCYCVYPTECFGDRDEPPKDLTCPPGYNPNTDPPRPPPKIVDDAGNVIN
uniref:Protein fam154b-like protein n=1 Tax=Triatoma infestans TaxID=30076 RepID=A0A170Z048_TRIIF